MIYPVYHEGQKAIEKVFEKQIFFVVGVMKSGNTWLQFLLDAHPEICCKGEGHYFDVLAPAIYRAFQDYNNQSAKRIEAFKQSEFVDDSPLYSIGQLNQILAMAIGLSFVQWVGDADVKCIGDKTPVNITALTLLGTMFPAAKCVHIIRDGRDAAIATRIRDLQINREATLREFESFDACIENFAKNWVGRIKQARDFGATSPDRYFELRYEDLHRGPQPIVRGLFEFLGVDAGDDVVSECINAASFERLSGGRKRGQEKAGAHMRKGVVGDWRNHFDEAAQATFHKQAGDLLKELGYDD